MTQAKVSVIIPTFNSASLVIQAIASAINQTVSVHQIIVVDDGSTDDTRAQVIPFSDRVTYIHKSNAGVAAARNTGIELSTGDLVAFLDADDSWHPRKIELQVEAILKQQRFAALGTDTFDWPVASPPPLPRAQLVVDEMPWEQLVVKNDFTTSSMMIRREWLLKTGGFDIALRGPEDHDLWLRLSEKAPVGILRLPLTGYRDIQGSLSKQAKQMEMSMHRILEKLDSRNAWQGRRLLRKAAKGYVYYSSAYMHSAAGEPAAALRRLQQSFTTYPLPYNTGVMRTRMGRLKLAVAVFLELVGLRKRAPRQP